MRWLQVVNMVAAGYIVAIAVVMLLATVIEPAVLSDGSGHQMGTVSVAGVYSFLVCAIYLGLRTIYLSIRTLFMND